VVKPPKQNGRLRIDRSTNEELIKLLCMRYSEEPQEQNGHEPFDHALLAHDMSRWGNWYLPIRLPSPASSPCWRDRRRPHWASWSLIAPETPMILPSATIGTPPSGG
jgi:hypothetical protein